MAVLQPLDDNNLDARYLYLALDKAKDNLAQLMQGTVYVTLKLADLANFEIPLPPLEIQKKLGKQHNELQSLIAKSKEAIARLEEKIQTELIKIWGD